MKAIELNNQNLTVFVNLIVAYITNAKRVYPMYATPSIGNSGLLEKLEITPAVRLPKKRLRLLGVKKASKSADKTIEEASELIKVGFEYHVEIDGFKLFRKRK